MMGVVAISIMWQGTFCPLPTPPQKSQVDTSADTATALAEQHGVSRATVIRDGKRVSESRQGEVTQKIEQPANHRTADAKAAEIFQTNRTFENTNSPYFPYGFPTL